MHNFVAPAIWISVVFLAFLLISKIYREKSRIAVMIITIIVAIFGLLWILLLAIMQYDDIAFPQEWWKFMPLSALAVVIIANALEGFGVISYTPELPQKS